MRPAALMLLHGAWQGAWVWDALAPLLRDAGYALDIPDLPGAGHGGLPPDAVSLADIVAVLSARLDRMAGAVAVVGHSGGGVVASQLAEARPDRVVALVYLAGMMLPSGMGFAEIVAGLLPGQPDADGIGRYLQWSADGRVSRVPRLAAQAIFLHDLPPAAARAAAARLTPQAEGGRALVPTLTPERFGRVRRLYVEALHDRSVVLAAQRRMQALVPGAAITSLPTGHAPHVVDPRLVAAAVLPWLADCIAPSDGGAA